MRIGIFFIHSSSLSFTQRHNVEDNKVWLKIIYLFNHIKATHKTCRYIALSCKVKIHKIQKVYIILNNQDFVSFHNSSFIFAGENLIARIRATIRERTRAITMSIFEYSIS